MDNLFQAELKTDKDILLVDKPDRRVLSKVPDKEGVRSNVDRRQPITSNAETDDISKLIENDKMGRRYMVDYAVSIEYDLGGKKLSYLGKSVDISTTGMLLEVSPEVARDLSQGSDIKLKFTIAPGTMPEGYEMKVAIGAKHVRCGTTLDGKKLCGVAFSQTLAQYAAKKKIGTCYP